jgi:hypothetical protein
MKGGASARRRMMAKKITPDMLDDSGYKVLIHGCITNEDDRKAIIKVVEKCKEMDAKYLNDLAKKLEKKKRKKK